MLDINQEERIIEPSDITEPTKKLSEMDEETQVQVRSDWSEHFNDKMFDEGVYKLIEAGREPRRFHDKDEAVKAYTNATNRAVLYSGDRFLRSKGEKQS